jgi:hypothetical protein
MAQAQSRRDCRLRPSALRAHKSCAARAEAIRAGLAAGGAGGGADGAGAGEDEEDYHGDDAEGGARALTSLFSAAMATAPTPWPSEAPPVQAAGKGAAAQAAPGAGLFALFMGGSAGAR